MSTTTPNANTGSDPVTAGVLGPVDAFVGGVRVSLGPPRQRALFAALVLYSGRSVSPDRLIDLIWGIDPPPGVTNTLQGYVHGLRAALEPDRVRRTAARCLVFDGSGYALRIEAAAVDAYRFEKAVLGTTVGPVTPAEIVRTLDDALSWWRGAPYADLGETDAAVAERARLGELRMLALELRAQATLDLGRHAAVAGELEALTTAYPLRERLWVLRVTALARSGRQAEALAVLRRIRALLDEELGLEPSPELRDLELKVLRQEVSLAAAAPVIPGPAVEPIAPVPLAGRISERRLLSAALVEAAAGRPQFVVLVGEPGIGKTRLATAMSDDARQAGFVIAAGRCAQDEGSPALWPWEAVLGAIGSSVPAADGVDPQAAFRVRAAATAALRESAGRQPLLIVVDDLHWADLASLRLLQLLVESVRDDRLCVVVTWRTEAEGAVGEVSAVLARRHALRIDLGGLDSAGVGALIRGSGIEPSAAEAELLWQRTEGNPYFALEYAWLAARGLGADQNLQALLKEAEPPRGVRDVLLRRLAGLPAAVQQLLQVAAVLGREVRVVEVTALAAASEDGVLAGLEQASAAGLVDETGVDAFRFSHALLQETVYGTLSRSRRARLHVLAAEALSGTWGRESESARHWLSAGPQWTGRAWRAALAAANQAARSAAFEDAVTWTEHAVQSLDQDRESSHIDRYDVALAHARALRAAGNWIALQPAVHRAIAEVSGRGDPERLLAAASLPTDGALWLSVYHGGIDPTVVAALQEVLAELPDGDSPARCRGLLALAAELYYVTSADEREPLAEEAVAIARRLGDKPLLLAACVSAATIIWRAGTAPRRLALTTEAVELARGLGDGTTLAAAAALRTIAGVEVGHLPEAADEWLPAAASETIRHRHGYARLLLLGVEAAWSAIRGDRDRWGRVSLEVAELSAQLNLPQTADAVTQVAWVDLFWTGRHDELIALLPDQPAGASLPLAALAIMELCRAGRLDEAGARLAELESMVRRDLAADTWISPLHWACTAEFSLRLGRPDLAAPAYQRLLPLAGTPATVGGATNLGPADAFLACAAAAVGDADSARRHADAAAALMDSWDVPPARRWLDDLRARYSF